MFGHRFGYGLAGGLSAAQGRYCIRQALHLVKQFFDIWPVTGLEK
jgi:hypothetical protein